MKLSFSSSRQSTTLWKSSADDIDKKRGAQAKIFCIQERISSSWLLIVRKKLNQRCKSSDTIVWIAFNDLLFDMIIIIVCL
jgi:hypothetical protein